MSWAKRNIYFLVCCIVAVVLLGAAGWYCWSSYSANNTNWDQLKAAYDQMKQFADKKPGPGNAEVDNIKAAKEQTEQARLRVAEMEKFFTPVKGIPDTNRFNDRMLAFAVRETVSQLRTAAQTKGVTIPNSNPEFAFSFSLQMGKTIYDTNSVEMLSKELGEVKTICDTLFGSRILALNSIQRERTADDASLMGSSQPDYTDAISLTNGNIVIAPYQVTFECYTPQLGSVLSSFANYPHTIVVKTLNIQPADAAVGGMGGVGNYGSQAGYNGQMPSNPYASQAAAQPQPTVRGGALPTIIDEKRLRVMMLLDFVKILPAQGK
jgi:hypothetical protein